MKAVPLFNPLNEFELAIVVGAGMIPKSEATPLLTEFLKPKVLTPELTQMPSESTGSQKPVVQQTDNKKTDEKPEVAASKTIVKTRSEKIWNLKKLRCIGLILFGIWVSKNLMEGRLVRELIGFSFLGSFCRLIGFDIPGDIKTFPAADCFPESVTREAGEELNLDYLKYFLTYTPPLPIPPTPPAQTPPSTEIQWYLNLDLDALVKIPKRPANEVQKICNKLAETIDRQLRRKGVKEANLSIPLEGGLFGKEFYDSIAKVSPKLAKAFMQLAHALLLPDSGIEPEDFWEYFKAIPIMPPNNLRDLLKEKILYVGGNEA